jgi:hypothetical protein
VGCTARFTIPLVADRIIRRKLFVIFSLLNGFAAFLALQGTRFIAAAHIALIIPAGHMKLPRSQGRLSQALRVEVMTKAVSEWNVSGISKIGGA